MTMKLPSLPESPRAETFSVEDLLKEAQRGHLRMPYFQTGLRWGKQHVIDLFDSILRGFPIGSLLLWEREAFEEPALRFGPVKIRASETHKAFFIVDGQQRLTSLIGVLLRKDPAPINDLHAIWVDLTTGAFFSPRSRAEVAPSQIPLNLLGDHHRLLHWSREQSDRTLIDRAFEIYNTISKYKIPAYIVHDAEQDALRQIFRRINASGVALNEAQVFNALFGDEEAPKPLDQLIQWLHQETGFGDRIPTSWLLRCLKAVAGISARTSFSEQQRIDAELLESTRKALHCAIKFLQEDAGFIHDRLLPYRFPLIILARFFHVHPSPNARSRALLNSTLGEVHW